MPNATDNCCHENIAVCTFVAIQSSQWKNIHVAYEKFPSHAIKPTKLQNHTCDIQLGNKPLRNSYTFGIEQQIFNFLYSKFTQE